MSDANPFDDAPAATPVRPEAPAPAATLDRRRVLKAGGAAAAVGLFGRGPLPLIRPRGARAQGEPLTFWQFYGPGGEVASQSSWFEETVNAWNEQNETQVRLEFTPVAEYLNGSKLQTAFASGAGPDIFIISPGDFLRYYNCGVLADLTQYMEPDAVADFYSDVIVTRAVD